MNPKVIFKAPSTLAQQCYVQLQYEVIEGILKPGEKLKIEPLKQRFNIGQSPIREALSRLVAFGLVDAEDNKGFRVATISEADIRDTYATFTYIENKALELAIERGNDAWEASIVAELHKLSLIENQQRAESYTIWAEQNYNFHVALISGCNSPTLFELRRTLYMKFDRYCRMAYALTQDNLPSNYEEHKKIAHAALERNVKKIHMLMSHHINGPIETIIKKFKENNLFKGNT